MNSKFIYNRIDCIKNISIDFNELENHSFILNTLNYLLNFSNCRLIYKNNNYYIVKNKKYKKQNLWYELYQKLYYFSTTKILFPNTNLGISINNKKKIMHIYNINTIYEGKFLNILLNKRVIFTSYNFDRTWNVNNVELIEIV